MGISLATIRANVLRDLGVDATDLDASGTANLDLLINRSWWEVMDKFDFKEKQSKTEFALTVGTYSYDLAAKINTAASIVFDALREVFIVDDDDNSSPLTPVSRREFEENLDIASSAQDIPSRYSREGGNIYVAPVPDDTYTLRVYHLTILADIPSGGPVIPQAWHEIIELGAIWRGHMTFRDFNSATDVQKIQIGLIRSAQTVSGKEDSYNKFSGVEVLNRPSGRRY